MLKHLTTVRLDPSLYKKVIAEAEKAGLNFSSVVHLLLRAFVQGTVHIGVSQYPKRYVKTLEKESAELSKLYKKRQTRGYSSSKQMLDDILQ